VGVLHPPKGFRLSIHLRQTLCILNDGHRGWAVLHQGSFSLSKLDSTSAARANKTCLSAELGPLCPDTREGIGKCSSTTTPTSFEEWLVSDCARCGWRFGDTTITNSHEPTVLCVVLNNIEYTRSGPVSTVPDFCVP
jgi:hypothetical protein